MENETVGPRYLRIYGTLRAAIRSGQYRPGDRLPSYQKLAQHFGVAGLTVRQAVDLLARDGLVTRRQGFGTFVTDRRADGRCVLVADDDARIRLLIRRHAEAAGYQVTEAQDTDAALQALAQGSFSHVFTDLRMPGPGGGVVVEAAHTLQARAVIVVVTGYPDDLALVPGGVVALVLRRPFSAAEIRAALDHARQANGVSGTYGRAGAA